MRLNSVYEIQVDKTVVVSGRRIRDPDIEAGNKVRYAARSGGSISWVYKTTNTHCRYHTWCLHFLISRVEVLHKLMTTSCRHLQQTLVLVIALGFNINGHAYSRANICSDR